MSLEAIIVIIFLILFIIGFMYINPLNSKHKIKNDNEYGSARFSTKQEIEKNFKKEYISNIKNPGVPILYSKDNRVVWFDRETPHYIYLGSTGSGKSVTAVIPLCSFIATADKKRSVFITDPKGEIFNTTSKMFKENGYNVITIDFRNPELSNKINLLEPIIKEYDEYIMYDKQANNTENDINYLSSCIESLKEDIQLMKNTEYSTLEKEEDLSAKIKELEETTPKV